MALAQIINIGIFVPACLLFVILAIIFGVKGSKRGPLRACISVILTLVAGVLAVLLSRLSASSLEVTVGDAVNIEDVMASAHLTETMYTFLYSLGSAVLAGTLFGFYFVVLALFIKLIVNGIINKSEEKKLKAKAVQEQADAQTTEDVKTPEKATKKLSAGSRWSGALISVFVDAVLVTALIFLPLYGTVARGASAVKTVTETALAEKLPEDSQEITDAVAKVADNPLLTFTRVQPFSFAYNQIFASSDISFGSLLEDSVNLVGDVADLLDTERTEDLSAEKNAAESLQKLLNSNGNLKETVFALVSNIETDSPYIESITEFLSVMGEELDESQEADEKDCYTLLFKALADIINNDGNLEKTEDLLALGGDAVEALARHPKVGVDQAMDLIKSLSSSLGEDASAILSEDVMTKLTEELNKAVTRPVGEGKFGAFLKTTYQAVVALGGGSEDETSSKEAMKDLLMADEETVESIGNLLSEDTLKGMGLDEETAETVSNLGSSLMDTIANSDFTEEEAEKEAENITYVMDTLTNAGNVSNAETIEDVIEDPQAFIEAVTDSDVMTGTIEKMTDEGSDFASSLAGMSPQALQALHQELVTYYQAHQGDADAAEILNRLNILAEFMGVDKVQ